MFPAEPAELAVLEAPWESELAELAALETAEGFPPAAFVAQAAVAHSSQAFAQWAVTYWPGFAQRVAECRCLPELGTRAAAKEA